MRNQNETLKLILYGALAVSVGLTILFVGANAFFTGFDDIGETTEVKLADENFEPDETGSYNVSEGDKARASSSSVYQEPELLSAGAADTSRINFNESSGWVDGNDVITAEFVYEGSTEAYMEIRNEEGETIATTETYESGTHLIETNLSETLEETGFYENQTYVDENEAYQVAMINTSTNEPVNEFSEDRDEDVDVTTTTYVANEDGFWYYPEQSLSTTGELTYNPDTVDDIGNNFPNDVFVSYDYESGSENVTPGFIAPMLDLVLVFGLLASSIVVLGVLLFAFRKIK